MAVLRACATAWRGWASTPAATGCFPSATWSTGGPESEAALEWLAQPWFYAVQGNHEDYAVRHVRTGQVDVVNWRGYGGGWFLDLPAERQQVYAEAFGQLPIAIEVETSSGAVGLLHADCPVLFWPRLESALQDRYKRTSAACQWSRDRLRQLDRTGVRGVRAVVAGHTPVAEPLALGNVYHIDTEGWKDGYFTFLDLETLQAWPRAVVTEPPGGRAGLAGLAGTGAGK